MTAHPSAALILRASTAAEPIPVWDLFSGVLSGAVHMGAMSKQSPKGKTEAEMGTAMVEQHQAGGLVITPH